MKEREVCLRLHISTEISPWVYKAVPYIFEVQMWWHASIDGYASDTCGLGLGQQQGVLHCNACSAGTFGHMPPPLQLFSSRQSPQSLADETHALLPLSTGLVDQEGVTVAVRQGEQYWLKELDLAHPWWLYLFTPTSELFQPLNQSSSVFAVELEASPAYSPGLPPVQIN